MTVRNPSPHNEPPPWEDIFTARVVDTSLLAPPGPPEASCSSRYLERSSDDNDDDDKEDTLSTRITTTTSIATTTTTSSLRDLGTPSVLLPASFHRDSLIDLTRMFFDEGNGVVHVKVRFGTELPQKPEELATLDDDLWNHLSANHRKFLVGGLIPSILIARFLFGPIFCFLLVDPTIPLYIPIIYLIIVDVLWRKRVKSQAILKNHMADDLKARCLAQGYNLDCYCYDDYEQGSEGSTRITNLCFVICPSSLDAQAFVRYQGDILLGEGFGTAHMHVTDFPKEKPKNLVTLDNDLWNDYAAKMIRQWLMNMKEDDRFFTLYVLSAAAWCIAIACYGWFGNIDDSGTIHSVIFVVGTYFLMVLTPICMAILFMILRIFILILMCIGVKFPGPKNILGEFTGRFQENGYNVVFVKEHGLVVFTPVWLLSDDHDTNTEIV